MLILSFFVILRANFKGGLKMRAFLSVLIFVLSISSIHASTLKPGQIKKLKLVKNVALKYPNKKGKTLEKTAMSICLTETSAGLIKIGDIKRKNPNILKSSLGIMQVRMQTARFIAKKLKLKDVQKLNDVELMNKLLGDDEFNARIAIQYLVWLSNRTKNHFTAVSRYNGGNVNRPYYNRVMKNMKKLDKHDL